MARSVRPVGLEGLYADRTLQFRSGRLLCGCGFAIQEREGSGQRTEGQSPDLQAGIRLGDRRSLAYGVRLDAAEGRRRSGAVQLARLAGCRAARSEKGRGG